MFCSGGVCVCVAEASSEGDITCCLPQGSIPGPILYSLYTVPLSALIDSHHLSFHLYADDTMIFTTSNPDKDSFAAAKASMERCCADVKNWMAKSRLRLNADKTEFIIIGSKSHLQLFPETKISISGVEVPSSRCVTYLGVKIDEHLSMLPQLNKMISSSYWQLRRISNIRQCLTERCATTLAVTLVMSNLDYCNSLLLGETQGELRRLQQVQNSAARVVKRSPYHSHTSPILRDLHWLPINQRIMFKTLCQVYKCVSGSAPSYLIELLRTYKPERDLRSSTQLFLHVPRQNTKRFGERSFACAGPKLWNNIPERLRRSPSMQSFKSDLKTFLFQEHN